MTTRNIVLIVVGVVLALSFLVAAFAGGIVAFAFYSIGNSEAAATAKKFLSSSERLKDEVGNVTGFGRFVTGSINVNDENGEATLNFKVIGDRKTVNASVNMIYLNGRTWRVSSASYENDKGEIVNLLDPYDSKRIIPLLVA